MNIIARISELHIGFGGEPPTGWIPPNAAEPPPTPVRHAIVDLRIEYDGNGYLLICESRNTPDSWDTWHPTLEEALHMAESALGIHPSEWVQEPIDN